MSDPIQVKEETVEMSESEYKAVLEFSVAIADQNAATEAQNIATQQAIIQLADCVSQMAAALQSLNIVVNVPPQPAPIVNVSVPEQAAPVVNVKPAAEKKKTGKVKFTRNNNGAITGADITTE